SGRLNLHRSIVRNNNGGGIDVSGSGEFDISNNFIYRNGNIGMAVVGGIRLDSFTNNGTNHLEFNTIVDNQITASSLRAGGLTCGVDGFIVANNIIARNYYNGMATNANSNTIGMCTFQATYINSDVSALMFKSSENPPFDYHILAGSAVIDQGQASMINYDFDGQHRPAGPMNKNDQGANEVQ